MKTHKLIPVQQTISITQGEILKGSKFSDVLGPVVAIGTKLIGSIPTGESADIYIESGGKQELRPLDIAVTEVATKSDVEGLKTKLFIKDSGNIKAYIKASAAPVAGEGYKVKVILWYAVPLNTQESEVLNNCY